MEEKKEGPRNAVSEVTANKWQGCMLTNIKKEESWLPLVNETWQPKKITNRGKTAEIATKIDSMLEYISQYAPNCLYRDITLRATSLSGMWTLIHNWAGPGVN